MFGTVFRFRSVTMRNDKIHSRYFCFLSFFVLGRFASGMPTLNRNDDEFYLLSTGPQSCLLSATCVRKKERKEKKKAIIITLVPAPLYVC